MPLTRLVADAFGVVTVCLAALLVLLGLFCIAYLFYFRSYVHSQGFTKLRYFGGPWIIRVTFILFVVWWGVGEIIRSNFLRYKARVVDVHDMKCQENVCKGYIVSNLGFAEPCLFLTLVFLLRAPLQKLDSGILSWKWNGITACCVVLYCLPVFVLQLVIILIGPEIHRNERSLRKLPNYFTRTSINTTEDGTLIALCTYPLLNTVVLGVFVSVITLYLFWLGSQILKLVINKGLQRRVHTLIFSVAVFVPLRILLLGLSVFSRPGHIMFEALSFSAFLVFLCCVGVCIFTLVYCPVADSLLLGFYQDVEARRRILDVYEQFSLSFDQNHLEGGCQTGHIKNSDASTKHGSISFCVLERSGSSSGPSVELGRFDPSGDATPTRGLTGQCEQQANENLKARRN